MNGYGTTETYDESDWESAFEDLEYDEARRRGRRRDRRRPQVTIPSGRPRAVTTPSGVRREIEDARRRDQQIARAVNETDAEVNTLEARVAKSQRDLSRLRTLSLVTLLLPRGQTTQRLTVTQGGSPVQPQLAIATSPTQPGVDVVTGGQQGVDTTALLLFMMLGRDIGASTSAGSSSTNDMLPILLIALLPGLQGQQPGGAQPGGLNTTTLLLVMMAMGGLT